MLHLRPLVPRFALTSLCAFGLFSIPPVAAQTTIGPTGNGAEANSNFDYSGAYYGQVFVVPADNVLNSFSVQVANVSPLANFSLYAFTLTQGFASGTAAGVITGDPLYSSGPIAGATVPTGDSPGTALEYTYQTDGLTLTQGGTYLALIQNITPPPAQTQAPAFADSQFNYQYYPGYNYDPSGALVFGLSPTDTFFQFYAGSDLAFRASFSPAVVPETSTVVSMGLLLVLGFGGIVIVKKKTQGAELAQQQSTAGLVPFN